MLDPTQVRGVQISRGGVSLEPDTLVLVPADDQPPRPNRFVREQWRRVVEHDEIHTAPGYRLEIRRELVEPAGRREGREHDPHVDVAGSSSLATSDGAEDIRQTHLRLPFEQPSYRRDVVHEPSIALAESTTAVTASPSRRGRWGGAACRGVELRWRQARRRRR